jgi:hypothetical protein
MSDESFSMLVFCGFCGFTAFFLFSIGYLVGAWHTLHTIRRPDNE